jgi:hypothetical protein
LHPIWTFDFAFRLGCGLSALGFQLLTTATVLTRDIPVSAPPLDLTIFSMFSPSNPAEPKTTQIADHLLAFFFFFNILDLDGWKGEENDLN